MERGRWQEIIVPAALSATAVALLAITTTASFSERVREVAYERQHGLCAVCGQPLKKGEGHHCVPKSKGGSNTNPDNCAMCHGSRDRTDCHEIADQRALRKGEVLDTRTNEFIPIAEAPAELFTNERIRQKTIQFYSLGEYVSGTINLVRGMHQKHHKHRHMGHRHGNHGRR